jgi:feruloyl esterase
MPVRILWQGVQLLRNPSVKMTEDDWQMVSRAGVKNCDAADGVSDSVAENPRSCHIDWDGLECNAGTQIHCLNAEQIALAQSIYAPLRDETGAQLDPGPMPGAKPAIAKVEIGGMIGEMVYRDAKWDPMTLRTADAVPGLQKSFPDFDIAVTDLSPFKKHGGRIIGYQGWLDPVVLPLNTVHGYDAVQAAMGGREKTQDFYRLFMVPGMAHCGGGPGANEFGGSGADAPVVDAQHDLLSALELWVEKGQAPESITASRVEQGKTIRTHPLCAYPKEARYRGTGSADDATNFTCAVPPDHN